MAAATRVGDWQCPNPACINNQQFPANFVYGSKVNCPKCGTGKSATRPGDWCCPNPQCVNHQNTVYGSKTNCSKCGSERPMTGARGTVAPGPPVYAAPVQQMQMQMQMPMQMQMRPGGVSAPRMGDWHCPNPSCKNHTDNVVYGSKAACPICGTAKPLPPDGSPAQVVAPQAFVQQWVQPPQAQVFNNGYGGYVVQPQGFQKGGNRPRGQPGDWHCANPACKNHRDNVVYASKVQCPICNTPKPAEATGAFYPVTMGGRPGDWQCPNPACKNHINGVYASKAQCTICGSENPAADRTRSRSPRAV